MPPPPSSFTEHLFKLASITRPPVTGLAQDLSKSVAAPHQASVLSAMLGHAAAGAQCRTAAATPPVPSVFPVFPGGIPASYSHNILFLLLERKDHPVQHQ